MFEYVDCISNNMIKQKIKCQRAKTLFGTVILDISGHILHFDCIEFGIMNQFFCLVVWLLLS